MQDNRQFFEIEVTRMQGRLYGAARRLTRNTVEAEDLVADAVLLAWTKLEQLEDRAKFGGWLMRILSNCFVDGYRKKGNSFVELTEDEELAVTEDAYLYSRLHQPFLLWYGNPEEEYVKNMLREDIEKSLDKLTEKYRVVVVMVDILGYKYEEVADQLGIAVGTIRSRLNRGRQQLQKLLWQHNKESGCVDASTHGVAS